MRSPVDYNSLTLKRNLLRKLIDGCFLDDEIDPAVANRALKPMSDSGLLTQRGRGSAIGHQHAERMMRTDPRKGGHTISIPRKQDRLPRKSRSLGKESESARDPLLQQLSDPVSSNPERLSSNLPSLSSNPQHQKHRRGLLNELPGELAARVGAIGQRKPPREVRDLVIELCRQRAFRAEELAVLLARNPETIQQNYLRPLLRERRLSMMRPDLPNDPEPAYVAVGVGQ